MGITVRALECLESGAWLTEAGNRNEGALRAKGSLHGSRFYYRYRDSAGQYDDLPLGSFDSSGKRGMTLLQARARVTDLRNRYLAGAVDLRASLAEEARVYSRQREAAEQEEAENLLVQKATLGALLTAYVAQLLRDGKPSARAVERALERHVLQAWPSVWKTPAARVTSDELLAVIAGIADAGKLREAAKVRSYLKAAYSAAIRARQDARGLAALRDLRLSSNPARDLVTIEGAINARERALSVAELRAYWTRIADVPGTTGALLQFHLLTGAQRAEQLGRLTTKDYDKDLQTIRFRDGKGRRKVPRIHDVPLIPAAINAMDAMQGGALGHFVFTLTGGESGAVYSTVRYRVREVVDAMRNAGELENGDFTLGDLRRTVETRLAAAGVSVEVRAQLQSHGLGGVQARHYDKHGYLEEKRQALLLLFRLMSEATVVSSPKRIRIGHD